MAWAEGRWCWQESIRKGWYLATTQPFDPSVTMLHTRTKEITVDPYSPAVDRSTFTFSGGAASVPSGKPKFFEGSLEEGLKLSFPDKVVGAVQLDLTVYSLPHHRQVK